MWLRESSKTRNNPWSNIILMFSLYDNYKGILYAAPFEDLVQLGVQIVNKVHLALRNIFLVFVVPILLFVFESFIILRLSAVHIFLIARKFYFVLKIFIDPPRQHCGYVKNLVPANDLTSLGNTLLREGKRRCLTL
jgi:hypothetical protein